MSLALHTSSLLTPSVRKLLIFSSFLAMIFVQNYSVNVCPFMGSLSSIELFRNLLLIFIVHVFFREWLLKRGIERFSRHSIARQAYFISILSWMFAGVLASLLHFLLYWDTFPFGSHLKLLSAYWFLGGAILAQLEYVMFERTFRSLPFPDDVHRSYKEQISRRVTEGFFLFTLAPSMTMILIVARQYEEGYIKFYILGEILTIGLLCVASSLFVAWMFGRMLKEDSNKIVQGVDRIRQGDLTKFLPLERSDELGEISDGINHMVDGLRQREQIREAFGKFVDPRVAETFLEKYAQNEGRVEMGGQHTEAVVLFSDIRGFTPLSESLPAEKTVTILNAYFSHMVEAIESEGGIVDKFIGDAVMAVFGIPDSEDASQKALRAAIKMRQALEKLNEEFVASGYPEITNGIGLHIGEVLAGYLGSQKRLEFTVVGNTVNIASRIESECRPPKPPIMFSKAFNDGIKNDFETEFVLDATLKGVSHKIALYTVKGSSYDAL